MTETLSHRQLQDTVKELKEEFGVKLRPITTRENLISQILETIGNATETQQDVLSADAIDVYNALLALPVNELSKESENQENNCDAYGISYEGSDPECQACDMAEQCKTESDNKKPVPVTKEPKSVKEKKVKNMTEKKETPPKAEVVKSRYGHKVGSMAAVIDDMVWKGSTLVDMSLAIVKQFNKEEDKATSKVKGHLVWLKKEKNVEIVKTEDTYKATVETI